MGFGPRESPNPGLLPPRGDRASTAVASSAASLHTTTQLLAASTGSNSSASNPPSLSSTIQGSFRATKSQGLLLGHQPHATSNELVHTDHGTVLGCSTSSSTRGVLVAEVSNVKDSLGSRKPPELISSHKLDNAGTEACDASSTIQGSFRATKSQGLPLRQHSPSSNLSTADLRCRSLNTREGISTTEGTSSATKSQGLRSTSNKLSSTNTGKALLRCPVSLDETAETGTVCSKKSSSHLPSSGRRLRSLDESSGRTRLKPDDLHELSLSGNYISEGKLKPLSGLASSTSLSSHRRVEDSLGSRKPPELISSHKLDNAGTEACDASSTIQGSFRATKSQGLPLRQHSPSSNLSTADLRCRSLNTREGISTPQGTSSATKSPTSNKLSSTNTGKALLRCPVSLDETAETGTVCSKKSSSHLPSSGRRLRSLDESSGRTRLKPDDLHELSLSGNYISEGKLKPLSGLASSTSSSSHRKEASTASAAACTHTATHGASNKKLVPTS